MIIAKLIFGILMMALAVSYGAAARHSHLETLALTAKLRDPDVKRRWIERDQPSCLAQLQAVRIGAGCIGFFGLVVAGMAFF